MMLEIFKLIFEINFFIFPISAGFLTYRKIKGRPAGRFFRMTITSAIVLLISFAGILINETPENKAKMIQNIERSFEDSN